MPTAVKCLFMFRDDSGNGWTETHYWNSQSDNPELPGRLSVITDVIAPLRAQLLSTDCVLIGTRVSYRRTGAVAALSKKVFMRGTPDQPGVSSDLSLACQFIDASYTKSKITHLRGFWDAVEQNGEYHPEAPAAAGWQDRLAAWKNALRVGGFGWLSKDATTSRTGVVSGYTSNDDLRISFTFQPPGLTGLTPGSLVQIRFSRLNGGSSVLNRTVLVNVTSATTAVSVNPIAAGPSTGPGRFNFRSVSFSAYTDLQNISLGRRAQGKPLGRSRGRAPVRPQI